MALRWNLSLFRLDTYLTCDESEIDDLVMKNIKKRNPRIMLPIC